MEVKYFSAAAVLIVFRDWITSLNSLAWEHEVARKHSYQLRDVHSWLFKSFLLSSKSSWKELSRSFVILSIKGIIFYYPNWKSFCYRLLRLHLLSVTQKSFLINRTKLFSCKFHAVWIGDLNSNHFFIDWFFDETNFSQIQSAWPAIVRFHLSM